MEAIPVEKEKYVTESEASKLMSFSVQTLRNWRCLGTGPPYCKVEKRAIRYRLSDLLGYMEAHKVRTQNN